MCVAYGSYIVIDDLLTLFHSCRHNPYHVLNRLLPQPQTTVYNLCQRAHNVTLPTCVGAITKNNFIYRMLFLDIY